ncbi:hypothetical protein P775_12110 [Puniceibacterium antarcticum]|uniref:Uncharacterized protein n=1 Tax=Puniceibacterium antarcticum TaxID=1206336 RepID=A0A2G8REH2_9RHOB|nr:hypothetical protein [Puniceibacterium antarcticum]PIL19922.1 hypothetical protein P775_12110 [Puniceibacterium antarcticum]
MTEAELINLLAPIRIPARYADFRLQDALLALSLGLIAGLIIARLNSVLTQRRLRPIEEVQAQIAHLSRQAPDERLVGLAELLTRYAPEQVSQLNVDAALYDPAQQIAPEPIEAAIRSAAKGRIA